LYTQTHVASEVVIQTLILAEDAVDTQNVSTSAVSVLDCSWDITAAASVARRGTAGPGLTRALLYGPSRRRRCIGPLISKS